MLKYRHCSCRYYSKSELVCHLYFHSYSLAFTGGRLSCVLYLSILRPTSCTGSCNARVGEIPSLKWSDISDNAVHIHSQQNDTYDPDSIEVKSSPYVTKAGKTYSYYNPTTKNEKGVSSNGRFFPMTEELRTIFSAIKEKQHALGIKSKFVFCKQSGEWITVRGYTSALGKIAKELGFPISNNHALRMAFNSYVLVEKGLEAPDRAKLLGHSVETNLRNYTYAKSNEYLDELRHVLDGKSEENIENTGSDEVSTPQYLTLIDFTKRRRTPKTADL